MTHSIQTVCAYIVNQDGQHRLQPQPQQGELSHTGAVPYKFTLYSAFPICFNLVKKQNQTTTKQTTQQKLTRIKLFQDFQNLPDPKPPQLIQATLILIHGTLEIKFIQKSESLGGGGGQCRQAVRITQTPKTKLERFWALSGKGLRPCQCSQRSASNMPGALTQLQAHP